MTVRIGITGPIGCGKSTVARWLAELGAIVIDADIVARTVAAPGSPTLAAVLEAFGHSVRASDGSLDRAALATIVFRDAEALARLEAIIHPAVRPAMIEAIERADDAFAPAIVIEAIKVIEGGLADLCDEVWLITCPLETQRARLAARGAPAADTDARLMTQGDIRQRLAARAMRVLDTSGSFAATRRRTVAAYRAALGQ